MLDYSTMVNDSLLEVVKYALSELEKVGVMENNHFYITVLTCHPDILLSKRVVAC